MSLNYNNMVEMLKLNVGTIKKQLNQLSLDPLSKCGGERHF